MGDSKRDAFTGLIALLGLIAGVLLYRSAHITQSSSGQQCR